MKKYLYPLFILLLVACTPKDTEPVKVRALTAWQPYDETSELEEQSNHPRTRMQYKLIQSHYSDKNDLWAPFEQVLTTFPDEKYEQMKPMVIEQDIPTIQQHIADGDFTYEDLVKFYLYRIYLYENDPDKSLHSIIALNPEVINQARARDNDAKNRAAKHPIYGMPILLKDNIGAKGMPTTAGAEVLKDNMASDAYIVRQLEQKGALILGKVNLSEWAYYFCSGCPLGYSALGGQTLNPYGRKQFETGGSSAASGTTMAANYAVAAVGTETAGSILSPSSQNSVVGLKPTIGTLSRTGIVPISSTLDTPGPMTKNVTDNAILFDAMLGRDQSDKASKDAGWQGIPEWNSTLKGKRFGAFNLLIERDSIYKATIDKLRSLGAEVVTFDAPEVSLDGFLTLLNIDMKYDLPGYLESQAAPNVSVRSVEDIVNYNRDDSLQRAPYGQQLFEGIVADSTTLEELEKIKSALQENGRKYFDEAMNAHNLDAVLSINNLHAAFAAVAKYPCLTVPMGYKTSGEPISLTFISKPLSEAKLYELGYAFEQATKVRQSPKGYE